MKINDNEVAVFITNYNYGIYLDQAINSVLNQTFKNIKLYVIDDASIDNSKDILGKYSGRLTVIQHKKNRGIVYSRNEALDLVKSQYMMFLDADDWLNEDYVEKLVSSAKEHSLDVAYCGMQYYIDGKKNKKWTPPEFNLERLKNENYIHSASLIKTTSISNTRFDAGMEKITHEDWDFFLNLALKATKFKRVDGVSLNYRFKAGGRNITNFDERFAKMYKYIYEKYINDYPQEIGYLAYYKFATSMLEVSESLSISRKLLAETQQQLASAHLQYAEVINSKSYKLGHKLTTLYGFARSIITRTVRFFDIQNKR
jgi:glycosyltransferase involved in cell wall biosynthesis